MTVYSRIPSRLVTIGGEQHSGWLPLGAAIPLPLPVRQLNMSFEITDDGGTSFLLLVASEDHSVYGDTWHASIEDAKAAAESYFGIRPEEWQDQPPALT